MVEAVKPYYEDSYCRIFHGDCRAAQSWLTADALVTDPPYGIRYVGAEGGLGRRGRKTGVGGEFRGTAITNDDSPVTRDEVLRLWGDRPALVFGTWKAPRPAATRAVLYWEKGEHVGMGDLALPWRPNVEEIYVLGTGFVGRRSSAVLRFDAPSPNFGRRWHPTEKPTALMATLVGKCPPTVVADPFMGSGSTLVAAKQLGRNAIGVEIEERYCEIAARRLAQGVLDFGEVG